MNSETENELNKRPGEGSLHSDYINRKNDVSHIISGERQQKIGHKGFDFGNKDFTIDVKSEIASSKDFDVNVSRADKNRIEKAATKPKSRKRLFIGIFLLVLFLGAVGFGYYKTYIGGGTNIVKTEWGDIALDVPQSSETVNVLALGFDKGGYRTDTMMIISFNPKTSNISLISIPRDTLIAVNGKRMKLNAAFAIGKFELTLNTIRQITGMPIHYYVAVDTEGFKNIVDALGGVDFDVKKDLKYTDPTQGLYIDLKKGYQHLDGNKAEQLVRFRKYAMADLERENVQKDFIKALIQQKLTLGNVTDVSKVKAVYDNLSQHVKTNAGFNDVMRYFVAALKIKSENFKSYTLPGTPKNINGISYYVYNKKETEELFKQLMGDTPPRMEVASGVEVYDVDTLSGKTQEKSSGTALVQKTTDKTTSPKVTKDSSGAEVIRIDDGRDLSEDDIIKLEPIKPNTKKTTQPKTTTGTIKESTSSTNTDSSTTKSGTTKENSNNAASSISTEDQEQINVD